MNKLVIDESKWCRGSRNDSRLLRPSDRKMCCMGFFCLQQGNVEKEIVNIGLPNAIGHYYSTVVTDKTNAFYEKLGLTSNLQAEIANVNDDETIDDDERKKRLAPLWASIGYELEYVNGAECAGSSDLSSV